jgi:hypothetical protein
LRLKAIQGVSGSLTGPAKTNKQTNNFNQKLRECSLSFSPKPFTFSCHIKKTIKIKIYKTVILPIVLYGCEPWSLNLKEEHRLRVFENSVLRIFGLKREEDGSWRKLHNDEIHSLNSSPYIFRVIKAWRLRWVGHVARMGEGRGVYGVLVGRAEGKRPLGRPRRRWEDNIKLDLRDRWGELDSAGPG